MEGWQSVFCQSAARHIYTSVTDNYRCAVKFDFLSYQWWIQRQWRAVTFPGCLTGAISPSDMKTKACDNKFAICSRGGKVPGVTSCFHSTSAVSQKLHHSSVHRRYPSHLCLSREVLPGAAEQSREGKRHRASSDDSRRDEISMREKWVLTKSESLGDSLLGTLSVVWQLSLEGICEVLRDVKPFEDVISPSVNYNEPWVNG